MSQRPLDILQRIDNEIDTAETTWQLDKAASIPEFDAADELHRNALAASQKAIPSRVEQAWQVLNFLLSVGLGLVKMIEWAEKRRQDATTCRLPAETPNFLRVRQPASTCHPGGH